MSKVNRAKAFIEGTRAALIGCNIARNVGIDARWDGHMYLRGLPKATRALVMRDRIESHASATTWSGQESERSWSLLG